MIRFASISLSLLACIVLATQSGCQFSAKKQNTAGVQRFQAGDYAGASSSFQQALKLDPRNADAHYNLGALMHRYAEISQDPKLLTQAEQEYVRCLQLNPDHLDCRRAHTVLLTQGNRAGEAYNALKEWAERNPTSAEPRIELARLYQESGDKRSADDLLSQALQIDPNSARAYAAIGSLREQSGEYSTALANYQRAYSINPTLVATQQKITELQQRGVNASPLGLPIAPSAAPTPKLVNAPGPMRRF